MYISAFKRFKYLIVNVIVNSRLMKRPLISFSPIIFSHLNALINMEKWIAGFL